MFGLCMPTGEVYLILKDGKKDSVMLSDLTNPKKEILKDKYVLQAIKRVGYKNVSCIAYENGNHITQISMADYYAERGQELEE